MKKFYSLILVFVISLFVVGCGSSGGSGFSDATSNDDSTYSLVSGKNSAVMGALKNATVKAYKYSDLNTVISETTTGDLGEFSLTLNNIDDTELLLVTVQGGFDIDTNDDGIIDDEPTENKGTIRGWVKASDLKNGSANITLLSEIVYQYSKHLIGNIHINDFKQSLNIISSKLLKINNSRSLNEQETINNFNPIDSESKNILSFDYNKLLRTTSLTQFIYDNNLSIEEELNKIFSEVLTIGDNRFFNLGNYVKLSLIPPIQANVISSNSSLFYNIDSNTSQLIGFIKKDENITFNIDVKNNYKIIKWYGCDNVSEDLKVCNITNITNHIQVSPIVVTNEIVMNPDIEIKDISKAHISIQNDKYTVTSDLDDTAMKTLLSGINIGDVIIRKTEPSFFKKVKEINIVDDNNIIFTTEFIPIEEVVSQGYLSTSNRISNNNSNLVSNSAKFISSSGQQFKLKESEHGIYEIEFNKFQNRNLEASITPWEYELSDGVKIKGSIKVEPRFNIDMDWKIFGGLKFLRIEPGFKITPNIELILEKELGGFGGTQNDKFIGSISHTQIFMVGLIPISITEDIKLYVGAEGTVKGALTFGGEITIDQSYPLTWSSTNGISFETIFNRSTGNLKLPEFKVEGEAGAYIKVEPGIRVYIVGVGVSNKIGLYGKLGASAGVTFNFTGHNVDADIAKIYFELYLKYQPQFTLSVPDAFANNEFIKGLKHDFENQFPPLGEVIYILEKKEFELLDTVIPKKRGELKLIGIDYSDKLIENSSINKTLSYKLENIGEEDLYWKSSIFTANTLFKNVDIFPKKGKLAPNEQVEVLVEITNNNLDSIGVNKGVLNFFESKDEFIDWIPPMSIPLNYLDNLFPKYSYSLNLEVNPILSKVTNSNIIIEGESIKNIIFSYDISTDLIDGYIIYKADYNKTNDFCYDNYLEFTTINDKNQANYSINLDTLLNTTSQNLQVEPGKSYCFNILTYKNSNGLYTKSLFMETPLILEVPRYGSIKTSIKDRNTNPVVNARVHLTSLDNNNIADGDGNVIFENLIPGTYLMTVEADGFINTPSRVLVNEGEETLFEGIRVIEEELEGLTGTINGKIINAVNSTNIENVSIEVRAGNSNTAGEVITSTTTDGNGQYSLTLPTGNYTFNIVKSGYTSSTLNVLSIGNEATTQDLSLSPILSAGEMRIVLRWGDTPSDLDSHLVKKTEGVQDYHIYYSSPTSGTDSLDRDDTDSVGPETVTISNVATSSVYTYYVYNYSHNNNTELKNSSATIDISYGNNTDRRAVPNEDGYYWKVFEIVNGEVVFCTTGCVQDDTSTLIRSIDREEKSLFGNLPSKN